MALEVGDEPIRSLGLAASLVEIAISQHSDEVNILYLR